MTWDRADDLNLFSERLIPNDIDEDFLMGQVCELPKRTPRLVAFNEHLERCYRADTIEEILYLLERDGKSTDTIRDLSPLALKVCSIASSTNRTGQFRTGAVRGLPGI